MTSPVVSLTEAASLRGKIVYGRDSTKPVYAFLGIPYASPPVGELRFQPTKPTSLWNGEWNATEFGPICVQSMQILQTTYYPYPVPERVSEDCLYLNIYTPDTRGRLPVMVYIHGGGFVEGFSNYYNGTALCTYQDVVVISINYRVGPFGFLCTGDGYVQGNMGLLDQVEALRWINKHVSRFGGDANNITLFGCSSGGISIGYHQLSPLSQGLFRRAICQSGGNTFPVFWKTHQARKYMLKKFNKIGCQATSGKEIVDFLNTKSPLEIYDGYGEFISPVLDGTFLPEHPLELLRAGKFQKMDLMLGFTSHEGAQMIRAMAPTMSVPDRLSAREIVHRIINMYYRGKPYSNQLTEEVMTEYFDGTETDPAVFACRLVDFYGHLLFMAPAMIQAGCFAGEKCRTFMYEFSIKPCFSSYPEWVDADHSYETPYIWGEPFQERFPDIWPEEEKTFSRLMMRYWTNFATSGDPNDGTSPRWPRYEVNSQEYIQLQAKPVVCSRYNPRKMHFWNERVPQIIKQTDAKL